ncbi:hypothetical protein WQG_770 [Bibersteinia trehalosi USDA-ARS-USMARC-192]|nr:hypothetical protein WQG_770 [Bibersteinia trehalosi USDA-ARS-USMARC-192]
MRKTDVIGKQFCEICKDWVKVCFAQYIKTAYYYTFIFGV